MNTDRNTDKDNNKKKDPAVPSILSEKPEEMTSFAVWCRESCDSPSCSTKSSNAVSGVPLTLTVTIDVAVAPAASVTVTVTEVVPTALPTHVTELLVVVTSTTVELLTVPERE